MTMVMFILNSCYNEDEETGYATLSEHSSESNDNNSVVDDFSCIEVERESNLDDEVVNR